MTHSKDCAAGLSDIDPTCEACIQQRLDRSRGYPPLEAGGTCDDCGKPLPCPRSLGTQCAGVPRPKARAAGVTPLGQCIAEQYFQDDEEWADYVRDMDLLPPWNEGIE